MSAGHRSAGTLADHMRWSAELEKYDQDPKFTAALQRYRSEDDSHDIPYGGGSDTAGVVIFFDRHLVAAIKAGRVLYKGQPFDPRPFIKIHEAVEGVLIRIFGLDYPHAHLIATAAERHAVERAGLNWTAYSASFAKFIRADEHESIVDPPKNLLLVAYEGKGGSKSNPMYRRLAGAQVPGARLAPDGEHYVADTTRPGKYLMVKHAA